MIRSLRLPCAAFFVAFIAAVPAAYAHVTVRPAEAPPGAETAYTVRVPTEGESTTTSVQLDIPEGVSIVSVNGAADTYEIKKTGDRVTAIVWKTSIPAGQRAELTFTARNPASGNEISWKAHQSFADGTRTDWIEAKGSKRPASITALKASQ
jgi:uncharacterized protein YcnI